MNKNLLPFLVLAIAGGITWGLIALKPEPERRNIRPNIPVVEFIVAERVSKRVFVDAFGTVRPRTSAILLAEAPGLIKAVAPFKDANRSGPSASFRPGGFFEKGDLLVRIEDIDHRAAKAEAEALLRTAELQLEHERALAEQAKAEWEIDRNWADAPELVQRLPQIRKAEADATAANARLDQATRNLNRANVQAPFRGRVLETMADVGQRVGGGASPALAKVYALDVAEVDLSLSRSELALLNFGDGADESGQHPEVHLIDRDGNITHKGELDRSEGSVDYRTRLTNVVAKIDGAFADPFAPAEPKWPKPLSLGEFVEARLFGPETEVFVIPRSAFREEEIVLTIDKENGINARKISSLKRTRDYVWVTEGLSNGERVCITPLDIVAAGMEVLPTMKKSDENKTQP